MTSERKNAIKLKRKYANQYANNRTNENGELKRMWQNIATTYSQATQEYCKRKTEDLKAHPREFYQTFRLFLSDKNQTIGSIHIRTDGNIKKNQEKVANIQGDYFSTMATQIGGAGVSNLSEQDLSNNSSLINIIKAINDNNLQNFSFQLLIRNSVCLALEKLNARKTTGYDSISPKILQLAASGIADPPNQAL